MLIIVHHNNKVVEILGDKKVSLRHNLSLIEACWKLAQTYPENIIGWCEVEYKKSLNLKSWQKIFSNDLILASFAIEQNFLPPSLGYVDQLPFVNINQKVKYGTWQMSSDVGGIRGKTLLCFKKKFFNISNFDLLINSIGKLGQQNGLFCYSAPELVNRNASEIKSIATSYQIFAFVYSHYTIQRFFLLFLCYMRFERKFPLRSFLLGILQKKYFGSRVDLKFMEKPLNKESIVKDSIDVIIPTLGRKDYLLQVLGDLKAQTHLPRKVIVIEQNSDVNSKTSLPELETLSWPFDVIHYFIHKTGACFARNIALKQITADWIFFADDDIRFESNLLKGALQEVKRLKVDCLNLNCKQIGEKTIFSKIKQWGSFGSGTSIVKANYGKNTYFDEIFENGFGEDQDYGMQLRLKGCDVVYHPNLKILHLKAPLGGFREVPIQIWFKDNPKPSPTVMVFYKKYYSIEQFKGCQYELFLRFYFKQKELNPWKYYKIMVRRWKKSEEWAEYLIEKSNKQVSIGNNVDVIK